MQSKSLLIAIAALALTTTGVQAYAYGGSKLLTRAGLTEDQQSALEEAHTLRKEGEFTAARDTLVEAGIDENMLRSLREKMHESRAAMHKALVDGNYEAFILAVVDIPLADIITTEEDFELFRESHELKRNGEFEEAEVIFDELGIEESVRRPHMKGHHSRRHMMMEELTNEQREALRVARQSNDQETIRAILEEAGIEGRGRF